LSRKSIDAINPRLVGAQPGVLFNCLGTESTLLIVSLHGPKVSSNLQTRSAALCDSKAAAPAGR